MFETIIAVIVLILTVELWLPLAFVFGFIKLVTSFSLAMAWIAMKSVPIWIWDFVHSVF
jgi:hypothetical protein